MIVDSQSKSIEKNDSAMTQKKNKKKSKTNNSAGAESVEGGATLIKKKDVPMHDSELEQFCNDYGKISKAGQTILRKKASHVKQADNNFENIYTTQVSGGKGFQSIPVILNEPESSSSLSSSKKNFISQKIH